MPIDLEEASELLDITFAQAEQDLLQGSVPQVDEQIRSACDVLFRSRTQAYREVALGCVLARIQDKGINIRLPYVDQGPGAFSGRSLDERLVNPFLQAKRVPCSRGPYLSVFRRSVRFEPDIRAGLRDKAAYDAFLTLISYLESAFQDADLSLLLRHLLFKFAELREASEVPISRLQRMSLEQYDSLLDALLATPSGGRFPVLVVVATFTAINEFFGLDWSIASQGINVADTPSGTGGDITISSGNRIIMAVEVTERPVERSRVTATFNTKIAPAGIEDYLFFVRSPQVAPEARQQARQYFAQGHEVNFLEIKNWVLMSLATMGSRGRGAFNRALVNLLEAPDLPTALKVAWNEQLARIIG